MYITPQKLFFLLFAFLLLKTNSLLMFLLHTVEHSFPLGYSLCLITHFPCAITLYLCVLSSDGFFPCLRISPLHNLMFEHHYNAPPWLQLDPYKAFVWLFLNLSSMFTSLHHSTIKCILGFITKILLPSCTLWSTCISSISSSDKWTVLLKLRTYLPVCTFH